MIESWENCGICINSSILSDKNLICNIKSCKDKIYYIENPISEACDCEMFYNIDHIYTLTGIINDLQCR